MASPGDSFYNPVTRTWVTFIAVPALGGVLTTEWLVPPGETLPSGPHYHFLAGAEPGSVAETFEVLSGTAAWRIGDQQFEAAAPARIEIPFNAVHVHPRNAGADDLRIRQQGTTGRSVAILTRVERYFETVIALSQEGRADASGKITDRLQAALTLEAFLLDPTYLPRMPRPAQKLLFGALAALARARGYKAFHQPSRDVAP